MGKGVDEGSRFWGWFRRGRPLTPGPSRRKRGEGESAAAAEGGVSQSSITTTAVEWAASLADEESKLAIGVIRPTTCRTGILSCRNDLAASHAFHGFREIVVGVRCDLISNLRFYGSHSAIGLQVVSFRELSLQLTPTLMPSCVSRAAHVVRNSSQGISTGSKPEYAGTLLIIRSTRDRDDQKGCALTGRGHGCWEPALITDCPNQACFRDFPVKGPRL